MTIKRPALRYVGSKWTMAPTIIEHMPAHLIYVEPFAGSAAVLLRKPRSASEIINDLDGDLINFFHVLREREEELIRAIHLTPYAAAEYELSQQPATEPLERARRFYVKASMGITGPTGKWKSGFRRQKQVIYNGRKARPQAQTFAETDHLHTIAERLRGVTIESMDALKLMQLYDSNQALFYLDPPYIWSTRGKWAAAAYRHEMNDDDHKQFLETAVNLTGHVLISGYDHPLYREALVDWHLVQWEGRVNGNGTAVECLWLAPHTWAALQDEKQPRLL